MHKDSQNKCCVPPLDGVSIYLSGGAVSPDGKAVMSELVLDSNFGWEITGIDLPACYQWKMNWDEETYLFTSEEVIKHFITKTLEDVSECWETCDWGYSLPDSKWDSFITITGIDEDGDEAEATIEYRQSGHRIMAEYRQIL